MVLSETRGLALILVLRGGIQLDEDLGRSVGPLSILILTLEPSTCTGNSSDAARRLQIVQTDCAIRRGSYDTPFFQTANTMAAIFRAMVRYAIPGRIPRAIIAP